MKLIRFLLQRSRGVVVLVVLTGLVSGACNTGLLALINALLTDPEGSRRPLLVGFIALCVLVPASRVASELLLSYLGQQTIFRLRLDLSRRVLDVPLRRLEELGSHRILATLTDDIPTITNVVNQIPVLAINVAVFAGGLFYLAWLSWKVFAVAMVFVVLGVVSYQLPIVKAARHIRTARRLNDDLYNHFRAVTQGVKELQLHRGRREDFFTRELETTAGRYRNENLLGLRILTLASSWGQVFIFVVVGLLLFVVPELWDVQDKVLTGYTLTLLYLMGPMQTLMNSMPVFGRAAVSVERVDAMGLQLSSLATPSAALPAVTASWNRLELDGVTHAYHREGEDSDFVLGPIDLTLRPGEIVFIAGGNGSGKTTLAKLLTGLYVPDTGQILWDGRPVTDENREAYRQSFSAVFSDFYLFPTLPGFGDSGLDERAEHYLDMLLLRHKVQVKDGRLSTLDLSQGQRKRLALLTAYLEDRPIYLFDEWAADQDPFFKKVFYHQILPELKKRNKTAVVISHDDRYFDAADRIIKLENGRIVTEPASVETAAVAF
ncbi:MAG TPA: cyclic peptide export ABC transporter [Thermoanaerobaculia bacterium]|nr:cyclic peptide export ABC transporter [Thermoanaerobaculia bacterium]